MTTHREDYRQYLLARFAYSASDDMYPVWCVVQVEPTWQVMEQFVLNEVQVVFGLDSLESSHPISIPVGHPDEISQNFDRISYAKGEAKRK